MRLFEKTRPNSTLESCHSFHTTETVTMASLTDIVPSGVITGDDVLTLFEHARANSYAIPAVNCTRCVGIGVSFQSLFRFSFVGRSYCCRTHFASATSFVMKKPENFGIDVVLKLKNLAKRFLFKIVVRCFHSSFQLLGCKRSA
jgi:hypothetical protein